MKIVISAVLAMFLIGCSSDESKSSTKQVSEVKSALKTEVKAQPQANVQKETPKSEAKVEVSKPKEVVQEVVQKQVEEVQKKVHVSEPVKLAMKVESVEPTKQIVASNSGETIFKACAACHGSHAEKKALNRSQIIKGWEASKVENALHGYKDGSYGGAMKGVMKGQALKLSDADIKAVADYISKL